MRLIAFLLLSAMIFVSLLFLFTNVTGTSAQASLSWWVWYLAGATTLISTAIEGARLAVFLFATSANTNDCQAGVTDVIQPANGSTRMRLAVVIPAHREVASDLDYIEFKSRLEKWCQLIDRSKETHQLFVLFDTDPADDGDQPTRETRLIREVNRQNRINHVAVNCQMREYRDKAIARRNKPGSIEAFLENEEDNFDLILVLDADSSPLPEQLNSNTSVLDQLARSFADDQELAMLQCGIKVGAYSTLIGWYQHVNASLAEAYFEPIENFISPNQRPSYGHHVVFRWSALKQIYATGIPQSYLSHDFVESALLSSQGWKCKSIQNIAFSEQAEEGVNAYLKRDFRWQRGNCQWLHLLSGPKHLSIGARYFLQMGWLAYVIPTAGVIFLVLSAMIISNGQTLTNVAESYDGWLLLTIVMLGLVGSKLGCILRKQPDDPGWLLLLMHASVGLLICPPLAIYSSWHFLFAPLRSLHWKKRKARKQAQPSYEMLACLNQQLPFAFFALLLYVAVLTSRPTLDIGFALVIGVLIAIIAGPITLSICSIPMCRRVQTSISERQCAPLHQN